MRVARRLGSSAGAARGWQNSKSGRVDLSSPTAVALHVPSLAADSTLDDLPRALENVQVLLQ